MKVAHTLAALALALAAAPIFAAQPHMEAALASLEQARDQLKSASGDKGGNRAQAINAVDKAIAEVKKGIEYDRKHQSAQEAVKK
ncbi:MAG: hypothetical protein IV094_00080 [Vitreoscilla sp.]|nr:hypothetical protein [Vitreoscilla sp.]